MPFVESFISQRKLTLSKLYIYMLIAKVKESVTSLSVIIYQNFFRDKGVYDLWLQPQLAFKL